MLNFVKVGYWRAATPLCPLSPPPVSLGERTMIYFGTAKMLHQMVQLVSLIWCIWFLMQYKHLKHILNLTVHQNKPVHPSSGNWSTKSGALAPNFTPFLSSVSTGAQTRSCQTQPRSAVWDLDILFIMWNRLFHYYDNRSQSVAGRVSVGKVGVCWCIVYQENLFSQTDTG